MIRRVSWFAVYVLVLASTAQGNDNGWKAGVAKQKITPSQPIWMSGYASRDRPSQGALTDIWAKALVLEDPAGRRVVAVTLDLVGIDRETALGIRRRLQAKHGLRNDEVAFFTSHTHTGPIVGTNLRAMYFIDDEQWARVKAYKRRLEDSVVAIVSRALSTQPASLSWGVGRATFAVNRRNNREADVPDLRKKGMLKGPVDHDVPVLRVNSGNKLVAILFGYACHATVLSTFEISGDYPGFAQIALEKRHPDAIALFWAGCGADQNPLPRRKVELAQQYGTRLADAVDKVLQADMAPVRGAIRSHYKEIPLAYDHVPNRDELQTMAASDNRYEANRGKLLLAQHDKDGALPPTYPYPVQTWHIGSDVVWPILGGEVVVDFALRLKGDVNAKSVWVAGYANDVMAYIPSVRVLKEGGYEGGGAMRYYGLPSIWADTVEELIVKEVLAQSGQ